MTPLEWLDLALRWIHFVAGIGWIGSSFYFIWLDRKLETPDVPRPGVAGELWMVHSGGFYQVKRRRVGPGEMPRTLHWFKWEAALTWLSGFFLLGVVYYSTHGLYLVDPAVSSIRPGEAISLGMGLLIVSWFAYDLLWRSPLTRVRGLAAAVSFALLAGVAFVLCQTLSGRAAYIHVGAMLGTLMFVNVWARILPAQQQMIDATKSGRDPDFTLGESAKRRSEHNSYMTLPVLFIMLSNHFPGTYAHSVNWIVLLLLFVVGVGVRHHMMGRGSSRYWVFAPVAVALVAVVVLTSPAPAPRVTGGADGAGPMPSFTEVRAVIQSRCVSCHSANPPDPTFGASPGGVAFDRAESILKFSERIRIRAVVTKTMPLANKTEMTEEERRLLGRWIEGGAKVD